MFSYLDIFVLDTFPGTNDEHYSITVRQTVREMHIR
jgi:hypothetical protein